MSNPKQVIVMRKDLGMRKGKMIAQGAHASVIAVWNNLYDAKTLKWIKTGMTKICVYVNSETDLMEIYGQALKSKTPCSLIQDAGKTEFNGVPTYTCCAIGPDYPENIDPITGHLPLL